MQQFQPIDQIQPAPMEPAPSEAPAAQVLDDGTQAPPLQSRPDKPPRQRLWPAMGWWRHVLACMGLASVVLLTFSDSYKSGMTLDNKYIIEEYYKSVLKGQPNIDLQSWQEIGLLFQNDYWWPKGISGLYRPITTFTYWLDYVVFTKRPYKTNPAGEVMRDAYGQPIVMSWSEYANTPGRKLDTTSYHTINLIVHWLNGVMLYFVSLLLIKRFWPAVLIAALFLAHPITTESVTNIIGRADMFAGVAVFGGLLLYVRGMRNDDSWALPWLFGLMLLTTFGVFSKESSAAVVLVAICYDLVFHWRTGADGKDGLAKLVGRSLIYLMVMILVPMMASSWSQVVLHPTRFPLPVRVGLAAVILAYGAGQYVLLAFIRPRSREPLLFFGGVLVSTIFASVVWPFYPLVLPIGVGLIELTRYWMKLAREDRFAELPRLIGHGVLYLALSGLLIGSPIVFSVLASDPETLAKTPHLLQLLVNGIAGLSPGARYSTAGAFLAIGISVYGAWFRSSRLLRAVSLIALAGAASIASIALPYFTLIPALAALAIELSRGSLTSSSRRFRVVAHATLYFFMFFFLIALPIAALIQFHRWGLDEWFPIGETYIKQLPSHIAQWQWYLQGGLCLAAGLFLHFATIRSDRKTRALALCLMIPILIVASFCSYFMGILLGIIVAIHELILGTLLPDDEDHDGQYRRDWKKIWHGFALGYMVLIPPLLAMMLVRMWVFSNATPAEEPFLDNPIRGIWKVQELGMKSFDEELAKKPLEGMSFPECKMTAVKVLGKCVYLVAWPWTLCSDYSYDEFPNFSWYLSHWEDWKAVLSLFFFIGCGYAAYKLRDRNRAVCFFILCFFAAALPTSNLTITIGSVMAERFMYLPLGAFMGVVVLIVFRLARLLYDTLRDGDEIWATFHYSLWAAAALAAVFLSTRSLNVNWVVIWSIRLASATGLLILYALLPLKALWRQKTAWAFIQFSVWSVLSFIAVCVASYYWSGNLFIEWGCIFAVFCLIVLVLLYLFTAAPDQPSSDAPANSLLMLPWGFALPLVVLSSLVVVYGVRAYDRNLVWESDLTLWTDAIKTSTRSFRCYQSLAFALYEQDARKNIDEMIDIDEKGIPIVDGLPNHLNSSRLYLHLGMFYDLKGEGLLDANQPGGANPALAHVFFEKARAILEKGAQVDRAFNELNYTKQLQRGDNPDTICNAGLGPVYTTLAVAYSRLGDTRDAANRLLYARQLDPTDPEVYEKYAYIMTQEGKLEDSFMSIIQAIVLNSDPGAPVSQRAWQYLPMLVSKMPPAWADAVTNNGQVVKMNLQNPLMRALITRAFRDMASGFLRARRPTMAMQIREMALSRYDWITADDIDGVFEEPIPDVDPDGIHPERSVPGPGRPGHRHRPATAPTTAP